MLIAMTNRLIILAVLFCFLTACVSETSRVEPTVQPKDSSGLPQEVLRIPEQMQQLSGELLRYHARHSQLPTSLDQLVEAGILTPEQYAALPDYLYVPAGQCVLRDGRVLVLIDSKPRIEGHAWCIVREPSTQPRSILLNVTPVALSDLDAATTQSP